MKILRKTLVSVLFFMCICIGTSAEAKEKPTSGKDDNGIRWTYDKITKTLTFSGNKKMAENPEYDSHGYATSGWNYLQEEAEHIVIEEGILGIGAEVFWGFENVKTVKIPNSVTSIDYAAFELCTSIEKITLPSKLKKIGMSAFDNCRALEEIVIPETVTSIGEGAFYKCENLKSIKVPDSVRKIGSIAFAECKRLESVALPKGLEKISISLFRGCVNLREIKIPSSVTRIGTAAFEETGIEEIVIPAKVTTFYKESRKSYKALYPLFKNCKNLRKITIKSRKIKSVFPYAFSYVTKKTTICVPKSKLKTYKKMFRKAGLSKKVKVRAI